MGGSCPVVWFVITRVSGEVEIVEDEDDTDKEEDEEDEGGGDAAGKGDVIVGDNVGWGDGECK